MSQAIVHGDMTRRPFMKKRGKEQRRRTPKSKFSKLLMSMGRNMQRLLKNIEYKFVQCSNATYQLMVEKKGSRKKFEVEELMALLKVIGDEAKRFKLEVEDFVFGRPGVHCFLKATG